MQKLKILITVPEHRPAFELLKADPGLDVTLVQEPSSEHDDHRVIWPVEWFRGTEILFSSGIFPVNLGEATELRWMQIGSAGYEGAITADLPRRGIRASNSVGVFDVPIAEWNICMIVALARDLRGMIHNQERAIWDRDKRFQKEVRGSTVGLWGYGGLGRETARLAKAMGMKVHVLLRDGVKKRHHYLVPGTGDPQGLLPDCVFNMAQKFEFLSGLDFLIVAMPQTLTNVGAIGEAELRALPRHACVLNPARGPLIQEEALLKALREGWIAGAALDTHYRYPLPADHALWKMPNVILTPHISGSGATQHYLPRVWEIFAENLKRYRAGEPLLNELTPSQLRGE